MKHIKEKGRLVDLLEASSGNPPGGIVGHHYFTLAADTITYGFCHSAALKESQETPQVDWFWSRNASMVMNGATKLNQIADTP